MKTTAIIVLIAAGLFVLQKLYRKIFPTKLQKVGKALNPDEPK